MSDRKYYINLKFKIHVSFECPYCHKNVTDKDAVLREDGSISLECPKCQMIFIAVDEEPKE